MIQIVSVHIEEFRGIRNLSLDLNRESFVVSGPNGSGKSGVVDAVQFALSGEIGRLRGAGTGELKLAEHGPHVDKRDYPDAALVRVDVYIPHLGKSATITRKIRNSKSPSITPKEDGVIQVFKMLEEHPEITLARREIIKFILTEAGQRSRDVQTLLQLEEISQTRATLKTTENKLKFALQSARTQETSAKESLMRHLDVAKLTAVGLLAAINPRRKLLRLSEIEALTRDTSVAEGLSTEAVIYETASTKASASRDIGALSDLATTGFETSTQSATSAILAKLLLLAENPEVFALIRQSAFLQEGLGLIDGPLCPLCDTSWDANELRSHLREKLDRSKAARTTKESLLESARIVSSQVTRIVALIDGVTKIAEVDKGFLARLGEWVGSLKSFSESLDSLDGMVTQEGRLETGWAVAPDGLSGDLETLLTKVKARPGKSEADNARDFLVVAQERLGNWRITRRGVEGKKIAAARGRIAYRTYCDVSETALVGLYEQVQGEFSAFYQLLNHDDEGDFKARFEPADGKLGLVVDFHKRGMFPPGAYHSEGHQDGMGVCLYLALMKRVLGDSFTLAVLDDVVMSVDSQHRKQFCKLLKTQFPQTQFLITTHDQVWAKQMRTEGVVGSNGAVAFHSWTVDTGPVLDEVSEIWDKIEEDLAKNEVSVGAARLRRHLEFVTAELADELGAKVAYRGDGGYDMGEFLGAVIGRHGDLLKRAAKAAKAWGNSDELAKIEQLQRARSAIVAEKDSEQWMINKAVHYNEWANLTREDFAPVVHAFKNFLLQFRCNKPNCNSLLSLNPKINPTDVRCACGSFRLNLQAK